MASPSQLQVDANLRTHLPYLDLHSKGDSLLLQRRGGVCEALLGSRSLHDGQLVALLEAGCQAAQARPGLGAAAGPLLLPQLLLRLLQQSLCLPGQVPASGGMW